MIGLDTTIIIRYLVQDDPAQSQAASAAISTLTEGEQGFISLVTLVEIHWVLNRAYGMNAEDAADVIARLADTRELRIDQLDVVSAALNARENGVDFADAVIAHIGRAAGCTHTLTFDRRAARMDDMHLLEAD